MNSTPQKSVLVTGAGSGIGASTARLFSEKGYFVYLLGRNAAKLDSVAREIRHGEIVVCDLTDPDQVRSAAQKIMGQSQRQVEVLVNNAGVFHRHSFEAGSDEIWMTQWWSNMMGPVRLTREFFPYFKSLKKGSVLNVSSTVGLRPTSETSSYGATKAAMINWTHSLALEGASFNIRVNCVCPGIVDTPIHQFHSFPAAEKEKIMKTLKTFQPLGRVGEPDEIARSIYFLASDESPWTTGAVLAVDGGINLT